MKKSKKLFTLLATSLVAISVHAAPPGTGWGSPVFEDNFSKLDPNKWDVHNVGDAISVGKNIGKDPTYYPWYAPSQVTVKNKHLVLSSTTVTPKKRKAPWNRKDVLNPKTPNPTWTKANATHLNAKLESKKQFKPGHYFEARIKMKNVPKFPNKKFWTTFWLAEYSLSEFDIMESAFFPGGDITQPITPGMSHHAEHNPEGAGSKGRIGSSTRPAPVALDGTYHVWGLLWLKDRVEFYVDGVRVASSPKKLVKESAKNRAMPILFTHSTNLANQPAKRKAGDPQYPKFEIDWVKVWKKKASTKLPKQPAAGLIGKTVTLKTVAAGPLKSRFVSTNTMADATKLKFDKGNIKAEPLILANKPNKGAPSTKFKVIDAGDGYIAFKAVTNNQLLKADKNRDTRYWPVIANGPTTLPGLLDTGLWERFLPVKNGDGTFSLIGDGSGRFLRHDTHAGTARPLSPTATNNKSKSTRFIIK